MRKRYYVGFFVVIFLIMICVEIGYQWTYQYVMEKSQTEESSLDQDVTVAAEGMTEKNEEYLLKELNGYVIVYVGDEKTIYEVTEIAVTELPDDLQSQIRDGIVMHSRDELYAFLENYSS